MNESCLKRHKKDHLSTVFN